jgi:CRP-like cAMP-binding protein
LKTARCSFRVNPARLLLQTIPVPHRDFFTYLTTLRPLELKAIGELSYVQHLAAGRSVYAAGDSSSAVYIVTRGVIELVGGDGAVGEPVLVRRGEFFGDLETLTGTPRRQAARARDSVSIQCFQRDDFNTLMRRAPSFFHFLTEQLAGRLQRAQAEAAGVKHESLELHGNLANFDLVTIYQTIVSSRQTGELRIFSETGELVSVFFFDDGQPRTGQFQHLTGEDAFTQLFLSETLTGTFLFSSEGRVSSCIQSDVITREAGDMLIRAVQARDELHQLTEQFADRSAVLLRRKLNFAWPETAPAKLRPLAEHLWQIAFSTPLSVGALYPRCTASELKIFQAIQVLVESGHFELCVGSPQAKVA